MTRRSMAASVALPVAPMDVIPFGPAVAEILRARTEAMRYGVDAVAPILYRLTEHQGKDGPYVETYRAWNNEDGARCRACPPGRCNFLPGPDGIGSCSTRRPGKLDEPPKL